MITATRHSTPSPPRPSNANELALQLTGRDYISHSSISTYQRCPLKYHFAYMSDITPAFVSSSLVFGSAIHTAIEHHNRALFEGIKAPSRDDLVGLYEESWKAEAKSPIKLGKTETEQGLKDLAARMLAAFQVSDVSKLDTQLLAVEEQLRGPIIEGCPDVLGRLDLVTFKRSALHITDYKTSRSRWGEAKIAESTPQQLLYVDLVKPLAKALGNCSIQVEWIILTKAKNPVVERHTLTPDMKQVARTQAVVRDVWRAISAGHFYPSPSSMNCSSCPYAQACKKWEG